MQSFIWWYFYCAFLGSNFGIFDNNVLPGVGTFGCIWLEWFARGKEMWLQLFEKCQIPTPCPASPPPPPAGFWLIGALLFHLKVMNYSAVYCHMTTCGIFFFWHAQEVKGCDFSWKKKSQNFAWLVQRIICLIFKQLIMTKLTMKIILKEGKGIQINFKHCIIKHNQ